MRARPAFPWAAVAVAILVPVAAFAANQAFPRVVPVADPSGNPRWMTYGSVFHGSYDLELTPSGGSAGMCFINGSGCWWLGEYRSDGLYMIDMGSTFASLRDGRYVISADASWFLDRVAAQSPWVSGS